VHLSGTTPLRIGYDQTPKQNHRTKALGMRAKNINGELRSTVAKQEAMTALQQKEFHARTAQHSKELEALTATLKEQASQIQKVSDRLEHLKPTKKDLMISRIISRRSVSGGTYFQPQIVLQLSLPSW
jgi:formate dehydrogenase maturation protein FdhE